MKTNKLLVITTIVLLLVNLVLVYFLWNNKRGHGRSKERKQERGDWVVKELQLDENQKAEHKKIRDAHFSALKPVFDSITSARRSLYSLIKDSSASDSTVQHYVQAIGTYHSQLTQHTFDHFKQLRTICNPDQQKKLDSLMLKIVEDMGRKRVKGK